MVVLIHVSRRRTTGKDKFLGRLSDEIERQGHKVVRSPKEKHDIYLDRISFKWDTGAPRILRLNGVHINSDRPMKKPNDEIRHHAKRADGIVYQSQFCKQMNERYATYGLKIPNRVIFNGAPVVRRRSKLATLYDRTFVACARWRPHKRLNDIVEAFGLANIPNAELVVLGKVTPRCVPNVRFMGTVSQDVVEALMTNAVASIHIAYLDWCPNSVVEAQMCGCPVITNNVGGTREIAPEHVVEIDPEYYGKSVRLYHPPLVDRHKIASAMWASLKWEPPQTDHIDIRNVAKQYIEFMETLL